jgi:hypothetical protein
LTTSYPVKGARRIASELVLASAVLVSCTSSTLRIDLPSSDAAKAIIIALDDGRMRVEVVAVRLDAPKDLPWSRGFGGEAHLTAILYDQDLDTLGLPEGTLTPADVAKDIGTARALPPNPEQVLEAVVEGDRAGAWRPASTATAALGALSSFHYESRVNLCPNFSLTTVGATLVYDDVLSMVPIDESSVLAVTMTPSALLRITTSSVALLPSIPGFFPLSAFHASDGTIWLGGTAGKLYKGTPSDGWSALPSSPSLGAIRWMDGPHDGSTFELFTMTLEGALERFDGTTWTSIFVDPFACDKEIGGVAWIRSGEAYAFPPEARAIDNTVLHFDTRRTTALSAVLYPSPQFNLLVSLVALPSALGITNASITRFGFFGTFDQDTYHTLAAAAGLDAPGVAAAFRDGVLGFGHGVMGAYYSTQLNHVCPLIEGSSPLQPNAIAPIGRGMLIGGHADDVPSPILFLDPHD